MTSEKNLMHREKIPKFEKKQEIVFDFKTRQVQKFEMHRK